MTPRIAARSDGRTSTSLKTGTTIERSIFGRHSSINALECPARVMSQFQRWMAYSPPGTGGVAAHQQNIAKLPLRAQTGWSFQNDHPGRAFLTFEGASTPP